MKRIIFCICVITLFLNTHIASAEINSDLDAMTEVRVFDNKQKAEQEAKIMLERLSKIDDRILKNVKNSGARLILSDKSLVELPEFEDLKGVIPRGHTEPWDNIPGLGGYVSYVAIGKSEPSIKNNHGDINLELHEFGHLVDMYGMKGTTISESKEFVDAHREDKNTLFPGDAYFEYVDEYFAEAFAYYYYTEASRRELFEKAPNTAAFLSSMHNKLLSVTEKTEDAFTIEWDKLENAAYYTVKVNTDTYDIEDTTFHIDSLRGNSQYETRVYAKDKNGEIIESSFPISITTKKYEDVHAQVLNHSYEKSQAVETPTEKLITLNKKAEEMFKDVAEGRVSQSDVDVLISEIEAEIKVSETPPRLDELDVTLIKSQAVAVGEKEMDVGQIVLIVLAILLSLALIGILLVIVRILKSNERIRDNNDK